MAAAIAEAPDRKKRRLVFMDVPDILVAFDQGAILPAL
jgi:hypothetical protein